jgi:acetolactate synthase-1/2/3 large subunit
MMAAVAQADLVLTIGIRFNWVLGYGQLIPNAKVIRVDIDPAEVDRNRMADVALVGDATAVLRLLNQQLEKGDRSDWVNSLKATFTAMTQEEKKQAETPSDPIHPIRLMHLLRQVAGDDHIFIVDGGDTAYFAMVNLRAQERAGVIGSGTLFGCLGTGVPFAIGAQLARPDKQVILVTGDGSFGFNNMEFETASRHCINIVSVICNDQAWGMVKHGHEICYETDEVCGTDLGVVHYEQIVEALGGYGEFVDKDDQIAPAIEKALKAGKPACVNVITDPTVTSLATMMFAEGFNL